MGWLFLDECKTREQIIEHVLRETPKVLAHEVLGDQLWVVAQASDPAVPIVVLFLLDGTSGSGWGYKAIDETMGPCYYACPLALLDMTPGIPGTYSISWREQVRDFHRASARR